MLPNQKGTKVMSKDAINYLKEQHNKAREHLEALATTTDRGVKTREKLRRQLDEELRHHMQLEEEIFYPAFKEAVDRKKDKTLFYEAKEEHAATKKVLFDLIRTDVESLSFGGKTKVLQELVLHHAKEEEEEMFPIAKRVLSKDELSTLCERMMTRKQQLESGRSWDRTDVAASAAS
jgi:iron-sulfur cluster repair protein YtfE (RIC family)